MKLWIGNPEAIPTGYTYAAGFDEAIAFIQKCEQTRKATDNQYNDFWEINEISVPFAEVDRYSSLLAMSENEKQFVLTTRE
jgi:hypothetical protein